MKYFVLCLAVCSILIGTSTQKSRNLQSPKPKAAGPATSKPLPPSTPNHPDIAGSPSQTGSQRAKGIIILKKNATQRAEDAEKAAIPTCDKWQAAWSLTSDKAHLESWGIDIATHRLGRVEDEQDESLGGLCDGIGKYTCCNSSMMMYQGRKWGGYVKNVYQYPNTIGNLYRWLISDFQPTVEQYVQRKERYWETLHKYGTVSKADERIWTWFREEQFDQQRFERKWKPAAVECNNFMQKVAKGAICSICDPVEHDRWNPKNEKQSQSSHFKESIGTFYLNTDDISAYATHCTDYLKESFYVQGALHKMNRLYMRLVNPNSKVQIGYINTKAENENIIAAMQDCSGDKDKCTDPKILEYYSLSTVNRLDKWNLPKMWVMRKEFRKFFTVIEGGWNFDEIYSKGKTPLKDGRLLAEENDSPEDMHLEGPHEDNNHSRIQSNFLFYRKS